MLLLVLLIAAQLFISRRTRRLINVPLFAATLVLVGFVGWFSYVAESGRSAILTAKEDAFDDLQTLYRAKVTAYLMKADESMWLFELRKARFEQKRLRAFYARSFGDSARQLIDVGHVADFSPAPSSKAPPIPTRSTSLPSRQSRRRWSQRKSSRSWAAATRR
ncbi:MAG: hypothetical protein WDN69_33510 [Aliidongia sp.]